MKRFSALFLLLSVAFLTVFVMSACKATPPPVEANDAEPLPFPFFPPSIDIVNNTGYTIYFVFISSSESESWGDDILGDNFLEDGESINYQLTQPLSSVSMYDFAAEDEEEDLYFKFDVTVIDNARIVFTLDDIYYNE
jgi:hypothetical protein